MPDTLDQLLAKGYEFVTVSELIALEEPEPEKPPEEKPETKPATAGTAPPADAGAGGGAVAVHPDRRLCVPVELSHRRADRAGGVPQVLKILLKAGLVHGECLTITGRTLAEELKDRNITVNAILPGTIDTPRNRLDMPQADFYAKIGLDTAAPATTAPQAIPAPQAVHVGFVAHSEAEVRAAHIAALAAGSNEIHPPGPQLHYDSRYYAVQLRDPDGYSLEFVFKSWQHAD